MGKTFIYISPRRAEQQVAGLISDPVLLIPIFSLHADFIMEAIGFQIHNMFHLDKIIFASRHL